MVMTKIKVFVIIICQCNMITMISITCWVDFKRWEVKSQLFHLLRQRPQLEWHTCVPSTVLAEKDEFSPMHITLKYIWITHSNQQCLWACQGYVESLEQNRRLWILWYSQLILNFKRQRNLYSWNSIMSKRRKNQCPWTEDFKSPGNKGLATKF